MGEALLFSLNSGTSFSTPQYPTTPQAQHIQTPLIIRRECGNSSFPPPHTPSFLASLLHYYYPSAPKVSILEGLESFRSCSFLPGLIFHQIPLILSQECLHIYLFSILVGLGPSVFIFCLSWCPENLTLFSVFLLDLFLLRQTQAQLILSSQTTQPRTYL